MLLLKINELINQTFRCITRTRDLLLMYLFYVKIVLMNMSMNLFFFVDCSVTMKDNDSF